MEPTKSYVCIDIETTGLNPKTDKITEIGAVKVIDGVITDKFVTFVNPGRNLGEHIVKLTGIHDEDLVNAPYINQVLPDLLEFIGDCILLGHSVLFDFSFIKKAAVDNKLSFERNGIDTLKIARAHLAQLEHRNLDYLCNYYGIPHKAHRALADAEATDILYRKLIDEFWEEECKAAKGTNLFTPVPLIFKVKRDTPATKAQKEKLYKLVEQHKIIPGVEIEQLSRSEASRLTDRILSEYGR